MSEGKKNTGPIVTTLAPNSGILLQPKTCSVTGVAFTDGNRPVVLKCGCVLCYVEADKCTTPSGFVFCPICEFTYNVNDKVKLLTKNNDLTETHVVAQLKRCQVFNNEIAGLCAQLDGMYSESELDFGDAKQPWLDVSDSSSVSDSSESDLADFMAFESTDHCLFQSRLAKLRARRDGLVSKRKAKEDRPDACDRPWYGKPDFQPEPESLEAAKIMARVERRKARRALRTQRFEVRQAKRGAYKVVHNVHVLQKDVPKKWRADDPKSERPADYEEKMREKQGWLTEQELEDMEEEEQETQTVKRRAAWRASRGKVPKITNSVQRQRWAERVYRHYRRQFFLSQKIEEAKAANPKHAEKMERRKAKFAARTEATRAKCAMRVEKLEKRGQFAKAKLLKDLFQAAEESGVKEVEDEEAAKRKAEEDARIAAEQAAAAKARAEEKAKLKAEAEARGEEWKDPDEKNGDEGDEGDED